MQFNIELLLLFMLTWVTLFQSNIVTEGSHDHYHNDRISCPGPNMLNENNGRIISHSDFNFTLYESNISCLWIILAPMNYVINVQLTFMSLEQSDNCMNDYLAFYNGYEVTSTHLIGRICGEIIPNNIISATNVLTVQFHTNSNINKMGFQLRYTFYQTPEGIVHNDCGTLGTRCDRSRECIARDWSCDGIDDCQDKSDELNCIKTTCASSTVACADKCIPTERFCGNISLCPEIKDKIFPPTNTEITNSGNSHRVRSACSNQPIPNTDMRIVGGTIARQGSWPWQVSLRNSDGVLCGGSIINSEWIVTAAHCVQGRMSPQSWSIHAGRFRLTGNENTVQIFKSTKVIQHSYYNPRTYDNDIAMMKINGEFQLNDYVQPVCLGVSVPEAGTKCYITGWGLTQGTGGQGYLKQAKVPIIDKNLCQQWYGNILTQSMICAGYEDGGIDSCQGDSGGPLVCKVNTKYQLIGITSWGVGCAQPRTPGIYTSTPYFSQWIMNVLSDNQFN